MWPPGYCDCLLFVHRVCLPIFCTVIPNSRVLFLSSQAEENAEALPGEWAGDDVWEASYSQPKGDAVLVVKVLPMAHSVVANFLVSITHACNHPTTLLLPPYNLWQFPACSASGG